MSSLQYSQVQPDNNKSQFNPLDTVIFTLNNAGRSLVLGSVKLEGKLRVNSTGTTRAVSTQDIRFNQNSGIASFIDSVATSTSNQSQLENISFDYGRWVNMVAVATTAKSDKCSSKDLCELKAPINEQTSEFCYGVITENSGAKETRDYDFSHKLKICLNRPMSGDELPYSKTGFTKISMSLSRSVQALFGTFYTDANTNMSSVNYSMSDLKISYQTVPDMGKAPPVMMRTINPIKSTLESDFSNVSSTVSGNPCDSVSICYQELARENNSSYDNQALNSLPQWNSIQYVFNNSNSEYVSYIVDRKSDAIKYAIEALSMSGHNQLEHDSLNNNSVRIDGISFGEFLDLNSQTINVQVSTDGISTLGTFIIYMFFHSTQSV